MVLGRIRKRKIYHCRPTNPNVKVIGDMESEIAWVVRLRWKILIISAIVCSFSVLIPPISRGDQTVRPICLLLDSDIVILEIRIRHFVVAEWE